jgi:hypothetical protein
MLSIVITPAGGPADLARLLGQLIPAAVDGLVRDVLLAGPAEGVVLELCEEAGVVVCPDRGQAEGGARSDWLMVLPQDFRLPEGWTAQAAAAATRGGGRIAEREGGVFGFGRRRALVVRRER